MSPLIFTCRYCSANGVAMPSMPRTSCGCAKPSRPASFKGFTATISAPLRLAACSELSMRGWLVPGFWPKIKMASDRSKSCRVTVPLLMPMVALRAAPLDSWHMFEQSGRLLVPNRRAIS